jgi:hypothetical protein
VNPTYIGMRIKNRTIIDHAYRRKTGSGKYRDFYVWRCKCGAEFIDVFGNIKARAHGACKACSVKGGAGARVDFVGQVFGDREVVKLVKWNEDAEHSTWETRCINGHLSTVTLDDLKRRGCMKCLQEQRYEEVSFRVGQTVGNRKILRYLGRFPVGNGEKFRGFYRYKCLLCGAIGEATYSNIVVSQDKKCLKCKNRKEK